METQRTRQWGPRSASYWLTALIAVGIIFIGLRFILAPQAGANGYGIPLPEQALSYGIIKGIRDIYSGIILFIFLIMRNRRITAFVFGAAIIIPLSDLFTVLSVNGPGDLQHLLIHGLTALYMLITTFLLFKKSI
jgi:hypothetical protein